MITDLKEQHKIFSSKGFKFTDPNMLEIVHKDWVGPMDSDRVIQEIIDEE